MDSSGMYGRRRARMPKRKVYCILKDEEYIYFPIAAQYSPYFLHDGKNVESYLAGMPNFFGGNREGTESIEAALAREIEEESQGKIVLEIPAALEPLVFEDPAGTAIPEQDTYKFYVLNLGNCTIETFAWGDDNVITLNPFKKMGGRSKDYCAQYEDSYLVRMDKGSFCGFIGELKNAPEAVHRLLRALGIKDSATTASIGNWYASHTFEAFVASVT